MLTAACAVVFCALLSISRGYPNGAPVSVCNTLTPQHGDLQPQTSESPFTLATALQRVVEGNKLRLVLDSPTGESFAGFMVQARAADGRPEPLGTFTSVPEFAKTLTCGSGIKNTLTHRDNTKKKRLEFEWEPPADYEGNVVFKSTFVKDGATFWVNIDSDKVQIVKRSLGDQPPVRISTTKIPIRVTTEASYTPPQKTKADSTPHKIYDGCKDKKLCFGVPEGCFGSSNCIMVVSTKVSPPNDYTFELLSSSASDYIAVGLSDDTNMGSDSVVSCTSEGKIILSKNDGKQNKPLPEVPWISGSVESVDGTLYCQFNRNQKSTVENDEYDLTKTAYFLLLARGSIDESGNIQYHSDRSSAGEKSKLSEVGILGAKSNLIYRLHGAFMLAAWIGFAGSGMLVARYFKKTWVGTQICGKDIWFTWHRGFMVLTWLLTCTGFIIIFIEVGGWYGETSNPHAVLGCVTTGLAFIQPFAAALRPGPGTPRRPLFNWGHWLVGNAAHILAIITIFFARQLAKAELPTWNDGIVSAYVAFHFIMHIIFSITDCCSERQIDKRVNNFPMKELGPGGRNPHFSDSKRDAPQSRLRKFLLAVYLIGIIGLTVALVVIASLAPIEENKIVKDVMSFLMPSN